jgi:hypothetical protein
MIEGLEWRRSGYCSGWGKVEGVEVAGESFAPKASWEMRVREQGGHTFV